VADLQGQTRSATSIGRPSYKAASSRLDHRRRRIRSTRRARTASQARIRQRSSSSLEPTRWRSRFTGAFRPRSRFARTRERIAGFRMPPRKWSTREFCSASTSARPTSKRGGSARALRSGRTSKRCGLCPPTNGDGNDSPRTVRRRRLLRANRARGGGSRRSRRNQRVGRLGGRASPTNGPSSMRGSSAMPPCSSSEKRSSGVTTRSRFKSTAAVPVSARNA
jgi:hypothetical protein